MRKPATPDETARQSRVAGKTHVDGSRPQQTKLRNDVWGQANSTNIETLKIDLRVGLTRAQLALRAARTAEKRDRNRAEARKAYDAVTRMSKRVTLDPADKQEIEHGLDDLKRVLEKLGDPF